jgi:hypothetical protein
MPTLRRNDCSISWIGESVLWSLESHRDIYGLIMPFANQSENDLECKRLLRGAPYFPSQIRILLFPGLGNAPVTSCASQACWDGRLFSQSTSRVRKTKGFV